MNSHSSSQPRSTRESARGAQNAASTHSGAPAHRGAGNGDAAAGVDTRNVRRALGIGFLLFSLTTIVTFFFSLFTALTWAVPVLSTAMALSCVLVVIAINGEASESAVERRSAPAGRAADRVAGSQGAAGRTAGAQAGTGKPAPAAKAAPTVKAAPATQPARTAQKTRAAEPTPTVKAGPSAAKVSRQTPAQKDKATAASPASKPAFRDSRDNSEARAERARRLAASSARRNDAAGREVLDLEAPTGEIPVVSTGVQRTREVVASAEFAPRPVPEPTYVKVAREAGEKAAQDAAGDAQKAEGSPAERESAAEHFAAADGTVPELVDAAKEDDGTAALKHGRKAIRADKQTAQLGAVSRAAEDAAYAKVNDLLARRRA